MGWGMELFVEEDEQLDRPKSNNFGIIPCMCYIIFLGLPSTQQLSGWADPAFIS